MTSTHKQIASQLKKSRIALYSILLPTLAFTLPTFAGFTDSVLRLVYIVLGFSLIIFLHELGHFAVARMCSVKCLAFSLGIGPRMLGWRKGTRLTFGNDPYDPETQNQPKKLGKTSGEKEDDKYALKPLDNKVIIQTEKGPTVIAPDTHNLTSDILGKPQEPEHPTTLESVEAATVHSDLPTTAEIPPHPQNVGDCDYRISWLPLGGYVRMLGQDDMDPTKVSNDPRAFNRRPIWQRMCIVSAGVIMNIIFAAIAFSIIFSPGIGVDFPPAVVGPVTYDMPAWGQLHLGDRIVSINGKETRGFLEFTDIQMESALSSGTEPLELMVHPADGGPDKKITLLPRRNDGSGFLAIGIESMPGTKIALSGKELIELYTDPAIKNPQKWIEQNKTELLKVRAADRIVAVDGVRLPESALEKAPDVHPYVTLYNHLQQHNDQPVKLTLENAKDKSLPPQDITLIPHMEPIPGVRDFPAVFGISPRIAIYEPEAGSPAAVAGLKEGDRIVRVGDRSFPTLEQTTDIIRSHPGELLDIDIERDAEVSAPSTASATLTAALPLPPQTKSFKIAPKNVKGKGILGIPLHQILDVSTFNPPAKDSQAGALELPLGSSITAINDRPVKTWEDIYARLRATEPAAKNKITFATPSGIVSADLALSKEDHDALSDRLHFQLGVRLENEVRNQHGQNSGQAVLMGLDHTKKFILQVYLTLAGLFRGTVEASNLHGIVGITKIGYDVQERGIVWLWYVLAMVSINLAVANFLPLPIVDGGLFLLLILEKIRGRPLSLKVQSAIQVVGIVLLAGLFLFVTMNDIKMFTK